FGDSFNAGDTHTGNAGNLNLVQGMVTVIGNGGSDSLVVNDHAASGNFNYLVDPTHVKNDPATVLTVPTPTTPPARTFAAGGIVYNATGDLTKDTVTALRLDATDQTNIIAVTPSPLTTFTMNGNLPVPGKPYVDGGDYLQLNTTLFADKVGGRKLSITSVGQGHWDFSDPGNTRPVYFESIERFNHVAITASTVDAGSGT